MHLPHDHPKLGSEKTGDIPHAKRPKPREPRSFRDYFLFPGRSLPTYTGPYPVGTMEIEVPVRNPHPISHIKRDGRHLLQFETLLMTVYYPASVFGFTDHQAPPKVEVPKRRAARSRELWLGRPRMSIAKGYGRFAGVGALGIPILLPAMYTKLPAWRNSPVARYWAPEVDTKTRGKQVKVEMGEKPKGASEEPVFPMILFSHGLGGTRTMYSSVCGEFASYGFVVCAVEHRDGSGPRTYINHSKSGEGSAEDLERRGHIDHHKEEHDRGFDIIDYIFPLNNPSDTSPHNEKGVDSELRKAQIDLRMAELEEAYHIMCELNSGNGYRIADRNLRKKGYKGSSTQGLDGVDWARWKGAMHTDFVTICGHSFGAATAVEMLRHTERFNYINQGIIYDIWGGGTRPKAEAEHKIDAPIIAINSEAFTYWPSNFELVASLVEEAQSEPSPCPSWLMTLRGTVHVSQSDFSLLYPNVCSLFLKMVANPRRALDLNINASLEFLSHTLPAELAQVNRAYKNENLLESQLSPLERIPSAAMHKPKDKYLAMRLQIRHEWIYRLSPKMFRQFKRWDMKRKGHSEPQGNEEVWLHVKPTMSSIEEYLKRTPGRDPHKKEEFDGSIPITHELSTEGPPVQAGNPPGGEHALAQPGPRIHLPD